MDSNLFVEIGRTTAVELATLGRKAKETGNPRIEVRATWRGLRFGSNGRPVPSIGKNGEPYVVEVHAPILGSAAVEADVDATAERLLSLLVDADSVVARMNSTLDKNIGPQRRLRLIYPSAFWMEV